MRPKYGMLALVALLGVSCGGDSGTEQADAPTCNARPFDPPGYESLSTEEVQGADHNGHRYSYRGPDGEELEFRYGFVSDAGQDLPQVETIPLEGAGEGDLVGAGEEWAFLWNDELPCDPMAVTATGLTQDEFVALLSQDQVIQEVIPAPTPVEPSPEPTISPTPEPEDEEEIVEEARSPEPPEYVAVFATAPEPGGVQPYRKGLVEAAGDNEWFGTVDCWKGLAPRLGVAKDRYAVGIVATTDEELDALVDRYGRVPILSDLFQHSLHCSASS